MEPMYLSIRPVETGKRIKQLLSEQNYTIREIQGAFGFENPQAIYKWISGKSLPSLDNFIILGRLLHTSIEDILVIDGDISFSRIFLNYSVRRHIVVGANRTVFSPDSPTRSCRAGTYRTFLPARRHVVIALFERQHCCF